MQWTRVESKHKYIAKDVLLLKTSWSFEMTDDCTRGFPKESEAKYEYNAN